MADLLETKVLKLVVTNEIKLAMLRKKNSLALSNEHKDEIRVEISKLKSLVVHLDIPEWKKDAINKKILGLKKKLNVAALA